MLKHEFESLAGYQVSDEDYNNIIEPMYMALPDSVTKEIFVKMIDKKYFALPTKQQLKNQMKKIAQHLFDICGKHCDYKAEEELSKIAKKYAKLFYDLDWSNDIECFVYTKTEYEFPEIKRGCTFPYAVVIGRGNNIYEEITLIKGVKEKE